MFNTLEVSMVNTQDIILNTSAFEVPWFKQELERNEELRNKINDTVQMIQQACSRQWTNKVKVVLKNDEVTRTHSNETHTCYIGIYVFFQGNYHSYIKDYINVVIHRPIH